MTGDATPLDERFERLYQAHHGSLVSFFGRRGLDPETSRDLAHETMIRVYMGLEGLRDHAASKSWVLTIAFNVYRNWVRDEHALRRAHMEAPFEQVEQVGNDGGLWPRTEASTESQWEAREWKKCLASAVRMLAPRQREAFQLWLDGWKQKDIAEKMKTSIGNVGSTLHRAREEVLASLRRCLRTAVPSPRRKR